MFLGDIKNKILAELPVPRNVKRTHKLGEYIKELLFENKDFYIRQLRYEKLPKNIQEKLAAKLSQVSRLWSMTGKEQNTGGNENYEGLKEYVTLFKKSVLLIGKCSIHTLYRGDILRFPCLLNTM